MKTIIGSAIGVLALGLVLIGMSLRGTASSPATPLSYTTAPAGGTIVPVNDMLTQSATSGGPVMVNCGPTERAMVRQAMLNGQPVSQVACVPVAGADGAFGDAAAAPVARRVAYRSSADSSLSERRVVYQQPTARRVEQPKRPWTKRLLVIGGSTAAGAGVGGLVGGKKGALIGAALGGGASTIWEATKK